MPQDWMTFSFLDVVKPMNHRQQRNVQKRRRVPAIADMVDSEANNGGMASCWLKHIKILLFIKKVYPVHYCSVIPTEIRRCIVTIVEPIHGLRHFCIPEFLPHLTRTLSSEGTSRSFTMHDAYATQASGAVSGELQYISSKRMAIFHPQHDGLLQQLPCSGKVSLLLSLV